MRLRPYKSCDSKVIENWIQDRDVFMKWGGEHFGAFPIDAKVIDDKYCKNNGDCVEEDNFYPWTAVDEDNKPVGHFIMRYTNGDSRQLRFGWVIVDDAVRGKGYGKQMLTLGLKYAFDILGADKVTIGVFEGNESAYHCYRKSGFKTVTVVKGEPWNVIEMEILRDE
ncbi:MAG: GNAT family N-acetyltransferase [Clostridia bacterium]|nr:GNAT family N-acetyltransferase [Clostridia bacterium]